MLFRSRDAIVRDLGSGYPWSGNVRELEQAVRRIVLTRHYRGDATASVGELEDLGAAMEAGSMDAETLLSTYCTLLYRRSGTYEEVARRTKLDRRTVKKYILAHGNMQ